MAKCIRCGTIPSNNFRHAKKTEVLSPVFSTLADVLKGGCLNAVLQGSR